MLNQIIDNKCSEFNEK
jgi:hypothetical protein